MEFDNFHEVWIRDTVDVFDLTSFGSREFFHICREPKAKIDLAIGCRSSLLGSLAALKSVQEALPHVDIPHITPRQIVAVSHANEYLLTDIANTERYHHSQRVFEVYRNSLNESIQWLHDVFKRTLKKDLDDAEDGVLTIAKRLRQYRANYIQIKIGNKLYVPEETGPSW